MDKKKMGNFIRKLRKEIVGSQDELANLFLEEYETYITPKAISDWEKGVSIPSIDNLEILSKIFSKSMDEILEGEEFVIIDYKKIYFIVDNDWHKEYDSDTLEEGRFNTLYANRQRQIIKINRRFKELLLIKLNKEFSHNEEEEFRFLFNGFYSNSDYGIQEYLTMDLNDEYLKFKNILKNCIFEIRNINLEEKYWELQKLYYKSNDLHYNFYDLDERKFKDNHYLLDRFIDLELWEKDLLLATIQNCDPVLIKPDRWGSNSLKDYEAEFGKEFNLEQVTKDTIRFLIQNGAMLNTYFMSFYHQTKIERRIIDRLEELYDLCFKPFILSIFKGEGKCDYYKVENSKKNRFIKNYYYPLKDLFINKSVDEIYDILIQNDTIPEYIYLEQAKKYNIDTAQEEKYWKADLNIHISYFVKQWEKFKEQERKIEEGIEEIKILGEKLNQGEKFYYDIQTEYIGDTDPYKIRDKIIDWKNQIDYEEFLFNRNEESTRELLDNLDRLSVTEIRRKYFKIEEIEVE